MADEESLEMAEAERKAAPSMESADAALRDKMPALHEVVAGSLVLGRRTRPHRRRKGSSDVLHDQPEVEDMGKKVISPTFSLRKSEK
jgi:hypothetical protein